MANKSARKCGSNPAKANVNDRFNRWRSTIVGKEVEKRIGASMAFTVFNAGATWFPYYASMQRGVAHAVKQGALFAACGERVPATNMHQLSDVLKVDCPECNRMMDEEWDCVD